MDAALVTSALLMGLAGGPHCAAMCGAAHGAIARQGGHARFTETMLALQAGRLVGYAVAGALVAASVAGLGALQEAAPIVRPLWTMAHVGAVALGVWLACKARAPAWLSVAGASQWSPGVWPAPEQKELRWPTEWLKRRACVGFS